jgi:hypothetical protein
MSIAIKFVKQVSQFESHWILPQANFLTSTFGLFLIFSFSFLIFQSCGFDVEDPTPPSRPVWTQKSLPEEWPEHGIDAHEAGGIYLEWLPNPEEDIVAYEIYRAAWFEETDSLGDSELIFRLNNESDTELELIDTKVEINRKYLFTIKAIDASGNKSKYSTSQTYTLMPTLEPGVMTPNGLTSVLGVDRLLSWRFSYILTMENFCLTILTQNNEFVFREVMLPATYIDWGDSWQIPIDVELELDGIYKWRFDTNADYINDLETSGSESQWAWFIYKG